MKYLWWIVGGVVAIGVLVLLVLTIPDNSPAEESNSSNDSIEQESEDADQELQAGRYVEYDAELVSADGYDTTVLFFYAGWCPECRAFDMAINEAELPNGLQILQVDYDDNQDLRQEHGVTIQSSFVRVDDSGDTQQVWSGYGKDKSLGTILENIR